MDRIGIDLFDTIMIHIGSGRCCSPHDQRLADRSPAEKRGEERRSMSLKHLMVADVASTERQIIVTDVTRMTNDLVCVAGIDLATGAMVRPLKADGSNWDEKSWVDSDQLVVGNIVALRPAAVAAASHLPHATEDLRTDQVTKLKAATPAQLYAACVETADDDIATLFAGNVVGGKYIIDGTNCRSLGCVLVDADRLRLDAPFDKVQLSWHDAGSWYNVKVTEVAIRTPASNIGLALLQARLHGVDGDVALRVGLARGWAGTDNDYDPKRCYLQLNGVIVPA